MKIIRIIVLLLIASIILFWSIALLRCEILTLRYGEQFEESYMQTGMISSIVDMKVLDYGDEHASIYYICEGGAWSSRVEFVRNASGWQMNSWDCIWSRFGSANQIAWPYIWHGLQYIQIPYWKGQSYSAFSELLEHSVFSYSYQSSKKQNWHDAKSCQNL